MRRIEKVELTAAACALMFFCNCAHKQAPVWIQKPQVNWAHVSTRPVEPVRDGYHILAAHPTSGLFPASMAVTRVAIEDDRDPYQMMRPVLAADPRNEFLQWNSALDDQMAIGEVFPIVERDLGGGEADPGQIMAAFQALHARLGLMYAVNELSETETEMFGVVYDTTLAQPVASLHAQARSVFPSEQDEEEGKEPIDLWETDSHALVRAEFERLLHDCIREMILRDEPAAVKAPTGWTPALPIRPVEWPPRRFRTGR